MKGLGAALILAGCLLSGALWTRTKSRRIRTLRQLCAALELLAGELETRAPPLPELAKLLAERAGGQAGTFFSLLSVSMEQLGRESFSQLWSRAAETVLESLGREEREEFAGLGMILGRCELARQLSALRACTAALRTNLREAEGLYPGQRRLSLGLTGAAAALLIIVLL